MLSRSKRRWYLIVLAVITFTCVAAYRLYDKLETSKEKAFADRIESSAQSMDRMGGHYITTFDWPLLTTLVQQAVQDPIIESVQIEDDLSGQVFGEITPGLEQDKRRYIREISRDGEVIGRVTLIIDDTDLTNTLSWLRAQLWFTIVAVVMFVSGFTYVLIRRRYESELLRQANFDSLTGLANRRLFKDRVEQAIKQCARENSIIGLLFIDIDHFKKVNDTLGHAAGDRLLIEVANRLKYSLRDQDSIAKMDADDANTLARLGGDEFTVILQGLRKPLDAEIVSERILKACTKPFFIDGQELHLSASIGISIFPDDAQDAESLMQSADAAMHEAKQVGRGVSRFYRSEMNENAHKRLQMENDLRNGFEQGELDVFYQPLISSSSSSLIGAEALLRWRSPANGMVPPDQFIPLAEEMGLIVPIGEWVLGEACRQAVQWKNLSGLPMHVSVNVSTIQFRDSDLVKSVSNALEQSSLPPENLKLEITESVLLQDSESTQNTIRTIHEMGVGFYIDDFGTGYSSLSYLRRYPFETLKIDRSFIANVIDSREDANLVESIIAMASNLNLQTVAEGIETDEQLAFIKNAGCDVAQGFGLGRPMPAEEFIELIKGSSTQKVADTQRG